MDQSSTALENSSENDIDCINGVAKIDEKVVSEHPTDHVARIRTSTKRDNNKNYSKTIGNESVAISKEMTCSRIDTRTDPIRQSNSYYFH